MKSFRREFYGSQKESSEEKNHQEEKVNVPRKII
jgi:hypothetical protein